MGKLLIHQSPSGIPIFVEGPAIPPSRMLWVDSIAKKAGNGSITSPLPNIQAALDIIGPPLDATEEGQGWAIYCVCGAPPEDITVPPRRLIFMSFVAGNVEQGASPAYQLGKVTWTDNFAAGFGAAFSALILSGFNVGGDMILSDSGTAAVGILALLGVVQNPLAKIDGTAWVTGKPLLMVGAEAELPGGSDLGEINAPTANLQAAGSAFSRDVKIGDYQRIDNCNLGDPAAPRKWTIANPVGGQSGFYGCHFDGPGAGGFVIDTPGPVVPMDGVSNFFFLQAGLGSIIGGAVKLVIEAIPGGATNYANGSYVGDGVPARAIAVPFTPASVKIVGNVGAIADSFWATSTMGGNTFFTFGPLTLFLGGLVALVPLAFQVSGAANNLGESYNWEAQS